MKFKIFLILFFTICQARTGQDKVNKYTFDGLFTYDEVLNSLALKSGRSVLGAVRGLDILRNFDIYDKPFEIAVDHVRKNLITDGFDLFYDSTCLYVFLLDSVKSKILKPDSVYTVYLPYSKRYVVTKDRQEYLNAKLIDLDRWEKDSLSKIPQKRKFFKCDLYVIGTTQKDLFSSGLVASKRLGATVNFSRYNWNLSELSMSLYAQNYKTDDALNFNRHIVVYIPVDSIVNLIFGTETRRENASFQSQNVVSQSYESVYDGLTVSLSTRGYNLNYRVDSSNVQLRGIPDSISFGSSYISNLQKIKNFWIFRFRSSSSYNFYLASQLKITPVDSL